jgi:hypothetical protein
MYCTGGWLASRSTSAECVSAITRPPALTTMRAGFGSMVIGCWASGIFTGLLGMVALAIEIDRGHCGAAPKGTRAARA